MTKNPSVQPTKLANAPVSSSFTVKPEPEPQGECDKGHSSRCREAPGTQSPGPSPTTAQKIGHALMGREATEIYEKDLREKKIDLRSCSLPIKSAHHISPTRVELGFTGGEMTPADANYLSSVVRRLGYENVSLKFVKAHEDGNGSTMTVEINTIGKRP